MRGADLLDGRFQGMECFVRSQRLLKEMGTAGISDLLFTLTQWATYERLRDNEEMARALADEADVIRQQHTFSNES